MEKHRTAFAGVALLALLILAYALPALAATFHAGDTFTVAEDEVIADDLYAAGESVSVLGQAQHDVVVAGGAVRITGAVGADVMAAGGSVDVFGEVGDDVRVAGGSVAFAGTAGGDAILAGRTVEVLPGARIQGDAIVIGERIIIGGTIEGDARLFGSRIELNGVVGGTSTAHVGQSLVVGDKAGLAGDLIYEAPREALISEQSRIEGEVDATIAKRAEPAWGVSGYVLSFLGAFFLVKFAAFLAASVLFVALFRRFSERVVAYALARSGESIVIGFAAWVVTPIAALILLVSLIGFLLALLLGFAYLALLTLAKLLTAVMAGAILSRWIKKEARVTPLWTALGVVALEFVRFVPIVGWLVNLLVLFAVLGSLARGIYEHWWRDREYRPSNVPDIKQSAPLPIRSAEE